MNKSEIRESVVLMNEGEKIFAVFHKPLTAQKFPAIIICHGFAGQKTGRYRLYVALAEELSKIGVGALRIDFRGCGDSEGDFDKTTFLGEVSDALKGLEFLKSNVEVDNDRLGIFGRSLGGAIAVIAAKEFKTIKSLCLFVPMFSADSWKNNLSNFKSNEKVVMNGQVIGREFLKQLFELRLEDHFQELKHIPFLHISAKKDQLIGSEHKENYKLVRKSAIANSEFVDLENSDHDFSDEEERKLAIAKAVAFFKSTL